MLCRRLIFLLTAGVCVLAAQGPAFAASPSKGLKVDRLLMHAIEETAEQPAPAPAPEVSAEEILAMPPAAPEEAVPETPPAPPPQRAVFKWPEKPGKTLNGMLFFPSLLVREGWDNNIYAAGIDDEGDLVSQVMPQLRVEIPDIRHKVVFEGSWEWRKYFDHASENQNNFHASLDGHLTGEHGIFVPFTVSGSRTHEERQDDLTRQLPEEPFEQAQFGIDSGLQFNPGGFAITLMGHYLQQRYKNGVAMQGGGPAVRDDANRDIESLEFNTSFDLNPRNTLMIWATTGQRDYQKHNFQNGGFTGAKRDSGTWSGMTSWMFDYPNLTGHITLGMENYSYEDPAIEDQRGFVGDMEVDHRINDKTKVNVQLARSIFEDEEVVDPIVRSRFGFYVDNDFRDNVLLAAGTDYNFLEFSNSSRQDTTWDFRGLADYIVNDFLAFGAEYDYTTRDSDAAGLDFKRSRFMLRARGRL